MPWMRRPDKAKRAGPDAEVFLALRSQVLNLDPSSIGVAPHDHVDIVRQLLAMGADPNARGGHGLRALGFARQHGHSRTVAMLTSAGAPE